MFKTLDDWHTRLTGWIFETFLQPALYATDLMNIADEMLEWVDFALFSIFGIIVTYIVCRPLEAWRPVEPVTDRRAIRTDIIYTLLARLGIFPLLAFILLSAIQSRLEAWIKIRNHRPMARFAKAESHGCSATHGNLRFMPRKVARAIGRFIAPVIGQFFDEDILRICMGGGEAPSQVFIPPDHNPRHARRGRTHQHAPIRQGDARQIPKNGRTMRKMRIGSEQGRARCTAPRTHCPGVGSNLWQRRIFRKAREMLGKCGQCRTIQTRSMQRTAWLRLSLNQRFIGAAWCYILRP